MYLWKCWRDTRGFFLVLAIAAVLIMPCAGAVTGLLQDFGTAALRSTFMLVGIGAAMALGARAAGQGFAGDTLQFLFTKPRTRAYFLWACWAVGCVEMLAIVAINFAAGYFTLVRHDVDPFRASAGGPGISLHEATGGLALFVLNYCLVYALTIALRSAEAGLGAGLAIVFGFPAVVMVLRFRWNMDLNLNRLPSGVLDSLLMALALIVVISAQMLLERREV